MSIRRTCASLLLIAVTSAAGFAQSPTTAPSAELKAAFEKLAADEAADREAARDAIVAMGPSVVEPLKALIATASDVEQRTGAQAALSRITETASVGATIVSLKIDNLSPPQAFSELSKASNYNIRVNSHGGDNEPKISLEIKDQPFWAALHQICKAAGYSLQNNSNNQINVSRGSSYMSGPVYVDGPFMIMARSISLNSNVHMMQRNASNKNMTMSFMCFVEPKLQISQRPYYVTLTDVTDDKGQSLVFPNAGMYGGMNDGGNQVMWDSNAQLKVPEATSTQITKLKGTMQLMAAIKTETMEIEDVLNAKNVTKTAAGYSLTVKSATTNGDQVTVSMSLTFPPNRRNAYQLLQQVKLVDAAGTALQLNDTNGPSGGNNRLDYRVTYQRRNGDEKSTRPAKLMLAVPTETKPLEFNFEFKDLPLPK